MYAIEIQMYTETKNNKKLKVRVLHIQMLQGQTHRKRMSLCTSS